MPSVPAPHHRGVARPGDHGGDGARVAASLGVDAAQVVDLSASMNPFAPDVATLAADLLGSLCSYPDAEPATSLLAAAMGVDETRLVLTNGGSEGIALVAGVLGDGAVPEPAFALYRRHLRTGNDEHGGTWRANPSSPFGRLAAPGEIAAVWDEAFWPITTGTWTRGDDAAWRLGSLTKLWSCPGLRLGYVIAPDARGARAVRSAQPQWSVNGLALALLPPLLDGESLPVTAARVKVHRAAFATEVSALGFAVLPGDAPWLLLADTAGLRARLALRNVVLRDCASFALPGVHRIGLPTPDRWDQVLAALAAVRADP